MSYLDSEKSTNASEPVELYKFVGSYATYCYTSAPEDIVYDDGDGAGPRTYTAINIDRSEVSTGTQDDDGLNITVTMSVLQTVAIDYAFTISPPKLALTIYRQQPDETVVYWTGPVNNITVAEGGRAQFNCPSALGAALTQNIPNVYYQTPCNNVLYSAQCQVDYALFSFETTIADISVDGKTITVAGIGALGGKLIGGELALSNGERRMIVSQTGSALVVNFPFSRIELALACTIAAGCDQDYTGDCKLKFNNQIHFNGFRFIPPINPFTDGIKPAEDGVTDDACVFVPEAFFGQLHFDYSDGALAGPAIGGGMNITLYRGGVEIAFVSSYGGFPGTWSNTTDGSGNITSETVLIDNTAFNYTSDADPFEGGLPDSIHIQQQYPATAFPDGNGIAKTYFRLPNETPVALRTTAGNAGVSTTGIAFGPGTNYHDCIPLWPNDCDLAL